MRRYQVKAWAAGLLLTACSTPQDIVSPSSEISSGQSELAFGQAGGGTTSIVAVTRSATLVELDTVELEVSSLSARGIRVSDARVASVTTVAPYRIFPRAIGDVRLLSSSKSQLLATILVRPAPTTVLAMTSHPSGTATMNVGDSIFVRAAYQSARFGVISCVGLTLSASPTNAVASIVSSSDGYWVKSGATAATATLTATCPSTNATTPLALTVNGRTPPPLPVLAVTSLSTLSGPVAGGSVLVLKGRAFAPGLKVTFGTLSSPSVTVSNDSTASVTVPASPTAGVVPVTAQLGSAFATLSNTYEYVSVVPPPPPPPAGVLFSTGFDDGTYGGMFNWFISRGVVLDSTANGGRSLQLDWLGNRPGDQNQGVGWAVPAGLKTLYVRFRYKVSANADLMGIKKTIRFHSNNPAGPGVGTLVIGYGAFIFGGDAFGPGVNVWPNNYDTRVTPEQQPNSTVRQNNPNTFKNRWRYIEMMLDYSDLTQQQMKLWVDGTLVTDYQYRFPSPLPSTFSFIDVYLASVFNGPGAAMSEWYDDIVISTSRIGTP